MLTDMTPTAGQLYGSQIPAMGMNISNIATHLQKPQVNPLSLQSLARKYLIDTYVGSLRTSDWQAFADLVMI
uniref:HDC18182 n=1 Tax=Drosophila melanogaster TaxID=7227 RepID=Q6III1_DROME|nr:TPA_inf: HDC18182 [Drosophila melanogaster]